MSRAARTIRWFGVYLVLLGLALVVTPNLLLSAFGVAETREGSLWTAWALREDGRAPRAGAGG
jgi:hypothetical protein